MFKIGDDVRWNAGQYYGLEYGKIISISGSLALIEYVPWDDFAWVWVALDKLTLVKV